MSRVVTRPPLLKHMATLPRYIAGSHRLAEAKCYSSVASSHRHLQAVLSANENPYGAGQGALEAIQVSLAKQTLHRYPEKEQEEILLEAIAKIYPEAGKYTVAAEQLLIANGSDELVSLATEQLLLANGSDELISLLVHASVAGGDNALVCSNSFPIYSLAIRAVGAEVREVKRLKPLFSLDINSLVEACDERTKVFFVANPDNPTGICLESSEIEEILKVLPPWVLLVLDGAYSEYVEPSRCNSETKKTGAIQKSEETHGKKEQLSSCDNATKIEEKISQKNEETQGVKETLNHCHSAMKKEGGGGDGEHGEEERGEEEHGEGEYGREVELNRYDSGVKWAAIRSEKDENYGRVVMLRTFSKIYGLAALRLGYAVAAPHIIETLKKIRMPFSVNSLAIAAGIGAIGDQKHVELSRKRNSEQRLIFTQFAESNGLAPLPSQANFVMLDCKGERRARALEKLWREAGFLTRSCAHNGLPHALRVTIGREDEMNALMQVPINLPKISS